MRQWESLFGGVRVRSGRTPFVLCILGLAMLLGGTRQAHAQVVFFSGTGHYYEAVQASVTWPQARDAAATRTYLGRTGHLVTITSAAEQAFVTGSFPVAIPNGYWIGAYQDKTATDFSEPAGGFRWVTGEPWQYTAWNSGEPNNNGGFGPSEDFVIFASEGRWNDQGTATSVGTGYIVEYDFPKPSFDVNGDGFADIVLQNGLTNQIAFWYMNGANYTGGAVAATIPTAGYALRGTGDFNGDGRPDLVFQNTTTGQIAIWFMNGATVIGAQSLVNVPAAGYKLAGIGDFNVDGSPDLVFQNTNTGQIAIWYMSGTALIGFESTRQVPLAAYKIVGIGDFNGDGQADLVFQNNSTGAIVFWYMNGAQFQSGAFATSVPYANFKVVGVNDYNNDGQSDILFQNSVTGQIAIWYMNGSTLVGGGAVGPIPFSNYVVVGPH
ncbi:MAG: hypothetical protein JWL77_1380 [Chthonomonadaceae bacterium]|nr:hypothetical protein [Chthonomonadaceae bacterium]